MLTLAHTHAQTWRMTAAARGVVGVSVAEEDSIGSALAEDAMAFSAACTMAADAYELLLLPLSAFPAPTPIVRTEKVPCTEGYLQVSSTPLAV